jgi:hypothetical protein
LTTQVPVKSLAQETHNVYVTERSSGNEVNALLVLDVTIEQIRETEALWAPIRNASRRKSRLGQGTRPKDLNWDWGRKRLQYQPDAARVFGILVDKVFEGLIMISNKAVSSRRHDASNQKMLYIEFLETAPRNQVAYVGYAALYKGVGRELIFAAISASADLGLGGRLALHSLSTAETFYRGFGFQDLGFDKQERCRYFELTDNGVTDLLGDVK